MTTKKLAALLAPLALVLAACGADVSASSDTSAPAAGGGGDKADSDTILIGSTFCLTGIQAPLDEPGLRGAQFAIDEINAAGGVLGKQLELVNLDGKSDPVTVGNNAVQLIDEGAVALIAPSDFDFGGPASREAQKAGIVAMSPGASSPLYGSKTLGDKQFTMSMWNTTMGAAAAEWSVEELGFESAYVVTDTFIDYTKSLSEYYIDSMEHMGKQIVGTDTYTQGDQDFSAQLQRLQSLEEEPDVIFVSSYMPDLGLIIHDIRAAGIDTPILGGDSYDDPELAKVLGPEYGNDIYFATHTFLDGVAGDNVGAWLEDYEAKEGEAPESALVTIGYDAVHVLAKAMEEAGSTDGAAMAKAMESVEFDLLTGKLSWSDAASGHEPSKEAAMVRLDGGETQFEGWFLPKWLPEP